MSIADHESPIDPWTLNSGCLYSMCLYKEWFDDYKFCDAQFYNS